MRAQGRYDRYVQTIDTGPWLVDVGDGQAHRAVLKPCMNCLRSLRYKGYEGGKGPIWRDFDLREFFGDYSTFFPVRPRHDDFASPSYQYTKRWPERSRQVREAANWRCSECGADLSAPHLQRLLHAHHLDGVKGNERASNLQALCALCHKAEPSHGHMRVAAADARLIEAARP